MATGSAFSDLIPSLFYAKPGAGQPSYESIAQRRKIIEAMMGRQRPYPKTFGEGLSSIGDSIEEARLNRQLQGEEEASRAYSASQTTAPPPAGSTYTPYTPPSSASPATTGPRSDATGGEATPVASVSGVHPNVASWHDFATRPVDQGGLGAQPHQAAGIVANLQHESGPQIRPVGVVGDNGTAFGAAQWRGDRFANLQNFAKANGMDPMTTAAQQAFMRHELTGSGSYGGGSEAGAYKALLSAQDPRSAATAFNTSYERSADRTGKREAAAANLARVMSDPASTPRDRIAAQEAVRTADTPLTPADTAQEARISDVVGMTRAPPSFGFGATASNRTGDVQSDMPPVTGALQGPLGASVGDTVQQRQQATQPPPQAVPPPPGPQLAQGGPFPPVVSAGGQPQAIIPGGGLPTVPPAAAAPPPPPTAAPVSAAPPDPRTSLYKAPEVPPPMSRPPPPKLEPLENERTRHFQRLAADPRLSPLDRQVAHEQVKTEQEQIKSYNAQRMQEYNVYLKQHIDEEAARRNPATVYSTEKSRRDLEADVPTPLTPDQRKAYGIPENLPAAMTREGKIQYGPAGTNIKVNSDNKATEKGDEKLQEKLSESFIKTFEEGNSAGDEIKQLAEMRALAGRVGTGAGAVVKQYLGQWGIKSEGLDEIQALQAGISRLIPSQRVPGSGTSSDFDSQMFKDSVVGLSKTEKGNILIFDTMQGLAKNKLDRADVAGRVISGEITRSQGVKEMLGLQRQARDLSDRVHDHMVQSGQQQPQPAIPAAAMESAAEKWARDPVNANNPRAKIILEDLNRRRGGQ